MAVDPRLEQAAMQDPELGRLLQEYYTFRTGGGEGQVGRGAGVDTQAQITGRLRALGIDPRLINMDQEGGRLVGLDEAGFLDRNSGRIGTGLRIAGGAYLGGSALSALGGGGGGAAAAPSLSAPVSTAAPSAGSLGGTVLGSVATGAGGGMDWGSLLRAGVDMGRGALQSQVDDRTSQDSRALTQDQLRLIMAQQEAANQQARAQTQIQQQTAAQQEQNNAYQNAVRASMVQAAQDYRVDRSQFSSHVPTISFSPGMRTQLGEGAQTAAATLAQQSQSRLENPTAPEALPTYTAPTLSTPTEQGFWEKLLGPVTAAGSVYAGLQPTTQAPGARPITGGR